MIIIFNNNNDNNFLKAQLTVCNIIYLECTDLDDLLKKKEEIREDFIFVISRYQGLNNDFYFNLKEINNIKENTILGYSNLVVDEKSPDLIKKYEAKQNNDNFLKRNIFFVKIKTESILKLKNKDIKNIDEFFYSLDYKYISNKNLSSFINTTSNVVTSNGDIILKNFRNKKKILDIKEIYKSYTDFNLNNNITENIVESRIIYNDLNKEKLSCFFIYDNCQKILDNLCSTKYNNIKNLVFILSKKKINTDKSNFKIKYFSKNMPSFNKAVEEIPFNYDVYILNKPEILDKILYKKYSNILDGGNKYKTLKVSIIYLKFIILNSTHFEVYLEDLSKFIYKFLKNNLLIIDEPNKSQSIENIDIKNFNKNIIDDLYEKKLYDECCLLINFVIKNRLYKNASYIYKTFSLIDKINYHISFEELSSLLNLINFNNIEEIFNVCVILYQHNLNSLILDKIKEFILNFSNRDLGVFDVLKLVYILYIYKFIDCEINISEDHIYLEFIIKNLNLISENYDKLNLIDQECNKDDIYASVLLFINTRFNQINDQTIKSSVTEKINTFLGINLEDLNKVEDTQLLKSFMKYPNLIWNSVQSLSDFMLTTEDILEKRKNLYILSCSILKNWDKIKVVLNKKYILQIGNFKYSYHGLPNKDLFTNLVKIHKNCININLGDTILNKFEKKNVSKTKIGFISDFLSREHSVFKDRHKVIQYLSKKKNFEVHLITFNKLQFKQEEIYRNTKHTILGKNTIYNCINIVRKLELDKLVFCEIGMDGRVVMMAHYRMANKQYNTWGHSDTSGYEEIDYFVSSKLYELPYEESQKHYSEKLILQNGMCTSYVNPTKPFNLFNTRKFYGLSDYEKIILCPQSLFKIHPDFDMYIFEILHQNPNSSIVLLDNQRKTKMYERWDKVLKNYPKYFGILSRVKFVPSQNHKNFCNLMKCADILIDPYPFGGCNSSLESFSLFKPLVTQPSIRINGRFTYGFYKKMEMDEMIANNKDEYVNITTKLLKDKDFYNKQVNLLKERSNILFEDQETLQEWEELMSQ